MDDDLGLLTYLEVQYCGRLADKCPHSLPTWCTTRTAICSLMQVDQLSIRPGHIADIDYEYVRETNKPTRAMERTYWTCTLFGSLSLLATVTFMNVKKDIISEFADSRGHELLLICFATLAPSSRRLQVRFSIHSWPLWSVSQWSGLTPGNTADVVCFILKAHVIMIELWCVAWYTCPYTQQVLSR